MDRQELTRTLCEAFDADADFASVVARQAGDMADAGQYAADFDADLDVDTIVENLADAPAEYTLAQRWNWWLGALDLSHGGYARFRVRSDIES